MRYPDTHLDAILSRVDIVELLRERIDLEKKGINWYARCPFHQEKTASFSVSPVKQFYHCFGCGAHGRAFDVLVELDGMAFPAAVEELERRTGLKGAREACERPARPLGKDPWVLAIAEERRAQGRLLSDKERRQELEAWKRMRT